MEPRVQSLDFASVYAEHAPYVRRQLTRRGVRAEDLDDVLQESFVTIHRLLPSFEGRSSLETWLGSVAWRMAAGYHRKRGRLEPSAIASEGSIADSAATPTIVDENLHASLSLIDEENRDVLALHDIGGLSISELADITGNARATIRQRLERARLALGRRMWRALTEKEPDAAWLKRLSPRIAERLERGTLLPPQREIIVTGTTAIATIDNLGLVVWRGPQTINDMEVLIEEMLSLSAASPNGILYLSIIEPSSGPPNRESRQMMAWGAGKLGPHMVAAAWAIEDVAMTAMVAPVVNACFFLGGVPINMRFLESIDSAAAWLGQYGSVTPAQITAKVEAMKRRLSS